MHRLHHWIKLSGPDDMPWHQQAAADCMAQPLYPCCACGDKQIAAASLRAANATDVHKATLVLSDLPVSLAEHRELNLPKVIAWTSSSPCFLAFDFADHA